MWIFGWLKIDSSPRLSTQGYQVDHMTQVGHMGQVVHKGQVGQVGQVVHMGHVGQVGHMG